MEQEQITPSTMALLVSDSASVREEVLAVLEGLVGEVQQLSTGAGVRAAVEAGEPDLVVLDMQVGNMGAIAACLDLRLEEAAGRLEHTPVLILLDRRADVFMARRSGAEGWLVKPLDPVRLHQAITALLAGGTYHDPSYKPVPVLSGV